MPERREGMSRTEYLRFLRADREKVEAVERAKEEQEKALKALKKKYLKLFDDARTMLGHLNDNKAINDQHGPAHLFVTISIAEHKLLWI